MAINPEQEAAFFKLFDGGWTQRQAALKVGISVNTASKLVRERPAQSGDQVRTEREIKSQGDARANEDLCDEAKEALQDFGYFQRRYFGRIAVNWQIEAANEVLRWLESPRQEYAVINAPPGSGKSTTFTHDIPAWITCRNRAVRGLVGSATAAQARWYVGRLRRTFERTLPEKARQTELDSGEALDAICSLAHDFGRFRPKQAREIWSQDSFVVEQLGGAAISEKEATWAAFGRDGGFLGGRYDIVIWDDLVDPRRLRTEEQVLQDQDWYTDIAESRLEPRGLLLLQGQRLGPNDLYRYALDMTASMIGVDLTHGEIEFTEGGRRRKYHHLKFPAHYDDKCEGDHGVDAKPYPEGCLLYPKRLDWPKLESIQHNRLDRYQILYQQEDTDPEGVLVNPAWINGDGGFPGCWDKDRDRLEIPEGVDPGKCLSVVAVDSSPTKYWAYEWWLYEPETERRFLIDLIKEPMTADKFLDWNPDTLKYTGYAEEWQQTSIVLGAPITHWIFEQNDSERFIFQHEIVKRWIGTRRVEIIPHETHRNKSDPDFGIQTIGSNYKFGLVRLPGKAQSIGRMLAVKLVSELTHYGLERQTAAFDLVVANWFFEWNLPNLTTFLKRRTGTGPTPQARPSWLMDTMRAQANAAGVILPQTTAFRGRDRLFPAYSDQESA